MIAFSAARPSVVVPGLRRPGAREQAQTSVSFIREAPQPRQVEALVAA